MAIFDRGYRAYEGPRAHVPAAWTIAREAWGLAIRPLSVRLFSVLWLLSFAGVFTSMLVTMSTSEKLKVEFGLTGERFRIETMTVLNGAARVYFESSTWLICLIAMFIGAGLVANDQRSKALSLYLARPLRRPSYVLGKALVLPGLLVVYALVPGLILWVVMGLWQPPGRTWAFYTETTDFPLRVLRYYFILAGSMTGLMLLASSLCRRAGTAITVGMAGFIGGFVVASAVVRMKGPLGEFLGALGIARNALRDWRNAVVLPERFRERWLPDPDMITIVALVLLAAGLIAVVWRTRSTEVVE
jgi:ABC-2 type transport system permease protein